MSNEQKPTPLTDKFVANKPPVSVSEDLLSAGKSVRANIVAWAEHACALERDRAELIEALDNLYRHAVVTAGQQQFPQWQTVLRDTSALLARLQP